MMKIRSVSQLPQPRRPEIRQEGTRAESSVQRQRTVTLPDGRSLSESVAMDRDAAGDLTRTATRSGPDGSFQSFRSRFTRTGIEQYRTTTLPDGRAFTTTVSLERNGDGITRTLTRTGPDGHTRTETSRFSDTGVQHQRTTTLADGRVLTEAASLQHVGGAIVRTLEQASPEGLTRTLTSTLEEGRVEHQHTTVPADGPGFSASVAIERGGDGALHATLGGSLDVQT